jgi:hypothetical protein
MAPLHHFTPAYLCHRMVIRTAPASIRARASILSIITVGCRPGLRRITVFDGNFCRINDGRALDLRVATDLGPIWIAPRRPLAGRDDSRNYLPSEKRPVNTEWKMNLQAYRGKWPFETRPSGSTARKSHSTEIPPGKRHLLLSSCHGIVWEKSVLHQIPCPVFGHFPQ